jgi:hypothetical protein
MRSSIELAWLREVAGRTGGAKPELDPGGVTAAPVVDAARGGTFAVLGRGPVPLLRGGPPVLDCGRLSDAAESTCPPVGGREAGVVVRDGPLGGGGVALTEAVALFGSFLFTHFFNSGS